MKNVLTINLQPFVTQHGAKIKTKIRLKLRKTFVDDSLQSSKAVLINKCCFKQAATKKTAGNLWKKREKILLNILLLIIYWEILKMPGEIGKKGDIRQYREDSALTKQLRRFLEENHVTSIANARNFCNKVCV